MNLHKLIHEFLDGRSNSVAIVCQPNAITLNLASPIAVPTGWGVDAKLTSATIGNTDSGEVTLHLNVLGFHQQKVFKLA